MSELTKEIASDWSGRNEDMSPSQLPYDERIDYWATHVPQSCRQRYHRLVEHDCAPRIAAAAASYAAGRSGQAAKRTQAEIAVSYGVSVPSIRKWYDRPLNEPDR